MMGTRQREDQWPISRAMFNKMLRIQKEVRKWQVAARDDQWPESLVIGCRDWKSQDSVQAVVPLEEEEEE